MSSYAVCVVCVLSFWAESNFFISKIQRKHGSSRCTNYNQYAGLGHWNGNPGRKRVVESDAHSERPAQLLGKAEQADQIQGVHKSHESESPPGEKSRKRMQLKLD